MLMMPNTADIFHRLSFNPTKSHIVYFSRNTLISYDYLMNSIWLAVQDCCKDLGFCFSSNLSLTKHYNTILTKAYQLLGLILEHFQNLLLFLLRKFFSWLLLVLNWLILPHLETMVYQRHRGRSTAFQEVWWKHGLCVHPESTSGIKSNLYQQRKQPKVYNSTRSPMVGERKTAN